MTDELEFGMTDARTTTGVFEGLALWLVPRTTGDHDLVSAIRRESSVLRERNAGRCSDEFGIHATLLAGLGDRSIGVNGLKQAVQQAVEQWKHVHHKSSLTVPLQSVTTKASYFQCILIALSATPALTSLNHITSRIVNQSFPPPSPDPSEPYFPHISLLYADLSQSEAQSQILQMQQQHVFKTLDHNPSHPHISFRGFTHVEFDSIHLYDCTGTPQQWKHLHTIPL